MSKYQTSSTAVNRFYPQTDRLENLSENFKSYQITEVGASANNTKGLAEETVQN